MSEHETLQAILDVLEGDDGPRVQLDRILELTQDALAAALRGAVPEAGSHLDTECRDGSCRFAVVRHTHDVAGDGVYAWEAGSREGLRAALRDIEAIALRGERDHSFAQPAGGFFRDIVTVAREARALGDTQEPRPDPLDVERLEKALLLHAGEFIEQPESFDSRRLVAENIAAIYARLAAASPAAPETPRPSVTWHPGNRQIIALLPAIGEDNRCSSCGVEPNRETGSCRCLFRVDAAIRAGAAPETREPGSEYGRLLAERDRLIESGVDPSELDVPMAPEPTPETHPNEDVHVDGYGNPA